MEHIFVGSLEKGEELPETPVSKSILTATPAAIDLDVELLPFGPNTVLRGDPKSRSQMLVRSRDWTSDIALWECTNGLFKWHYAHDEVMVVISGEAFLVEDEGRERRFGPGDLGFFPAGTVCTWRVPEGIRKVAIVRETMCGELVEVKPMASIVGTLNAKAYNRGLWFSPDMRLLCGQRRKVERRLNKIIVDGTGEMRQLQNTVYLEGSMCGCPHVAFGGCSRCEFVYWREIWLRRVGN